MFSEEMKQEMLEYGFTYSQISSKVLEKFIEFSAKKRELFDAELSKLNDNIKKEYESLNNDCKRLMCVKIELQKEEYKVEQLKKVVNGLENECKHLEEEIAELQDRKCNESVDDAHARNFIGLIEKIRSMKLTDQEMKTFGFIGNGFFNGTVKDETEFSNEMEYLKNSEMMKKHYRKKS